MEQKTRVFCETDVQEFCLWIFLEKIPDAKDGKQKVSCSGIQYSVPDPLFKTREEYKPIDGTVHHSMEQKTRVFC